MKRRTMLAGLALGIGGAAVAGYGAAMGRDAWRATKKKGGFLLFLALIACAIVLPFLGHRLDHPERRGSVGCAGNKNRAARAGAVLL